MLVLTVQQKMSFGAHCPSLWLVGAHSHLCPWPSSRGVPDNWLGFVGNTEHNGEQGGGVCIPLLKTFCRLLLRGFGRLYQLQHTFFACCLSQLLQCLCVNIEMQKHTRGLWCPQHQWHRAFLPWCFPTVKDSSPPLLSAFSLCSQRGHKYVGTASKSSLFAF